MTVIPAEAEGELARLRAENARLPLLDGDRCWWLAADFDGLEPTAVA